MAPEGKIRLLANLRETVSAPTAGAFRSDGRVLALGGQGPNVDLWNVRDPEDPQFVTALPEHGEKVLDVAFSPNGKLLAVADNSGDVKIWDVSDPKEPSLLGKIDKRATRIAFTGDSKILIMTTGVTTYFFDVARPQDPVELRRLDNHANDLQISVDQSLIVRHREDYKEDVRLWRLPVKESAPEASQPVRPKNGFATVSLIGSAIPIYAALAVLFTPRMGHTLISGIANFVPAALLSASAAAITAVLPGFFGASRRGRLAPLRAA